MCFLLYNADPTTKMDLLLLILNKTVNPLSPTLPFPHSLINFHFCWSAKPL